jgi:hypothetical protein
LTAAGIALTRVPVGVVAGFPRVVVAVDGDHAVVHLELATADCLTPAAPARPEDAGCLPTASEFADLGTPALRVDRSAGRLTLSGRFPTYRRPDGAAPMWTGRSRDVTVTLDLPGMAGGSVTVDGRTAAFLPG